MGEQRACHLVEADRTIARHRRPDQGDEILRDRMRELAGERRRFGYRRLHVLLHQEGLVVNRKRTRAGFAVRKGLRPACDADVRSAVGTRAPVLVETVPNARWSVDFVHDQLVTGRCLRILNVIDDVTTESLKSVVDASISGARVARELAIVASRCGKPVLIVSDHGTEFTSNTMLTWTRRAGLDRHPIAPGKPMRDTASVRRSMVGCGTSCCFAASTMPARRPLNERQSATTVGRTRPSDRRCCKTAA